MNDATGNVSGSETPERVPCPWCAEPIMTGAKVCRFCGRPTQRPEKESNGYGCLVAMVLAMAVIVIGMYLLIAGNYG